MRKEGNRPLSVPKKRRDNETRNYSATRNSTSARKNPIAVPFDPPSNGPKSIVGKMKSSIESTSQTIGGSSNSHKIGDRRKTRHIMNNNDRNIPPRQSSRSLSSKRKEEEVIEITSDQEDNCDSGEETPKPTLRKRRLIQPDDDSDDEGEVIRPSPKIHQRKEEGNDDHIERVANKLKSNRIEMEAHQDRNPRLLELKAQQQRQAELKIRNQIQAEMIAKKRQEELDIQRALKEEYESKQNINRLKKDKFEKEKELAINRERERTKAHLDSLKARLSAEHQLNLTTSSSSFTEKKINFHQKFDIPVKRTEPTLPPSIRLLADSVSKTPSPFIEKRQTSVSSQGSSKKNENYFNLPADVKSLVRSARDKITRSIYQQPCAYKEEKGEREEKEEKEVEIKSQPIVGDIFDFGDDDFKIDSPKLSSTTTKGAPPQKKKLVEEAVKIVLPYDPIDDDPLKPIGSDQHLLTYPFEGKKSVTVYERDLTRLDEDQYLNDTLLDIFPKIWDDDYPTSKSTHTFSSFFYTKLAGDGNSVNYDKIGRWTANINIFEKSMIIIPVAQNYHWYLIVVTNPSRCIRNADSYGLAKNDQNEDIDINYIEEDRPPRVGRWRNQVPSGAVLNPKKAYIMLLDSLGGMKKETCTNISEYLKKEAMEKLNIQEDDFIEPEFVSAHCPTQKNFVDCGVFCLHYIRSLYQDPHRMMKVLYNHQKDDKGWDSENTLPVYRQILRRILKKKMVKYREYLTGKLKEEEGYF